MLGGSVFQKGVLVSQLVTTEPIVRQETAKKADKIRARSRAIFCISQHGCCPQARFLGLQESNQLQQCLKNLQLLWQKSTQIGPFLQVLA